MIKEKKEKRKQNLFSIFGRLRKKVKEFNPNAKTISEHTKKEKV